MAIKKIDYLMLDGDPAVMIHHSDGQIYGYVRSGDEWKPAPAANLAWEATQMIETDFKKRWPGLTLPTS